MKKLLYLLGFLPLIAVGQSTDQNYIKTLTYRDSANATTARADVTYLDGLGRPIQKIAGKMSGSGYDLITPIEYDVYGRQTREYLPYPVTTTNLTFDPQGTVSAVSYYQTSSLSVLDPTAYPYSEKFLEFSPLARVLKQSAPGDSWKGNTGDNNDHTVKFNYLFNSAAEVKLLKATAVWNSSTKIYSDITFSSPGNYAAGQLYKTITKDENWVSGVNNTTEEFKNKDGQIVLKRNYSNSVSHDTYYVYDQFGNLTYVLPPLCEGANTYVDNYGYQYKYDSRNRIAEKKLPGKQWEYIVYDVLDQPVATGPAFSPFGDGTTGWMITKYDAMGRVAYTGWYTSATFTSVGRQAMQANTYSIVTKTTTATTIDNIGINYTNSFPTAMKVLSINYYDNYAFSNAPTFPIAAIELQNVSNNVKGLPTGSWVRILTSASDTFGQLSYTLYDLKGRPISIKTSNTYLGGYNQTDTKLDFDATPIYTITRHKRLSSDTELVVREDFLYSEQDRLLIATHKINTGTAQRLTTNTYNNLGQLTSKLVGGTTAIGSQLQTVDYKYNIRGWLTDINDISTLGSDLFAFKINYNTVSNSVNSNVTPLFNGNISETQWLSSADNVVRKYGYKYDNLNRLTNSYYQKPGQAVVTTGSYNENIQYDKNGNISGLVRYGAADDPTTVVQIDQLQYTYLPNSNQLKSVYDTTGSTQGFKDYEDSLHQDYTYDTNGNLSTDKNKSITAITYNHLDLPVTITFGSNGSIAYLYDAAGQKLKKTVVENQSGTNVTMVVDYLGGFQYKAGVMQFFPTSEGYVDITKVGTAITYSYVYQYKDHSGNVRMNFAFSPGKGSIPGQTVIKEEGHYYPFGLRHQNYNMDYLEFQEVEGDLVLYPPITASGKLVYNYRFGGKELQEELGLQGYDFGARNYDPALGRWMNIDPLAEQGRRWTPYAYAFDNPVYFIDPDGMWPENPFAKIESMVRSRIDQIRTSYNNATAAVSKAYTSAKASVVSTINETRTATVSAVSSAIKTTKQAGSAVQGFVKDHKEAIKAVAKNIQDVGDKVTDVGLVVAATGVVTEGATVGPGMQIAGVGEITSAIGTGVEFLADAISGDLPNAATDAGAFAVGEMTKLAVDKIIPGPNPDVSSDVKQLIQSTREVIKNKAGDATSGTVNNTFKQD